MLPVIYGRGRILREQSVGHPDWEPILIQVLLPMMPIACYFLLHLVIRWLKWIVQVVCSERPRRISLQEILRALRAAPPMGARPRHFRNERAAELVRMAQHLLAEHDDNENGIIWIVAR